MNAFVTYRIIFGFDKKVNWMGAQILIICELDFEHFCITALSLLVYFTPKAAVLRWSPNFSREIYNTITKKVHNNARMWYTKDANIIIQ